MEMPPAPLGAVTVLVLEPVDAPLVVLEGDGLVVLAAVVPRFALHMELSAVVDRQITSNTQRAVQIRAQR